MECFGSQGFTEWTRSALRRISVKGPDEEVRKEVLRGWDAVAKPLDGMGRFEALTAQIGAILGSPQLISAKRQC